jgi:hypothetical protein
MKTIEEAAKDMSINKGLLMSSIAQISYVSFESGVEFAKMWIDVNDELPEAGWELKHLVIVKIMIPDKRHEEFEHYMVSRVKSIYKGIPIWAGIDKSWKITHWRPIEFK